MRWDKATKAGMKAGRRMSKNIAKWELAKALKNLPGWDLEDGLELVGLQRRRTRTNRFLSSAGLVAAGMVVGAALGMILAPKSGTALRQDLINRGRQKMEAPGNGSRGQQAPSA